MDKSKKNFFILGAILIPLAYLIYAVTRYFNDNDSGLFVFNFLITGYIILWSVFILFIYFRINKDSFFKYADYIVFIFTFLFLLFWIPFGLDLTDEGKQMSISWFMFHGNIKHTYEIAKFGSWFVNGMWLSILPFPFLLWERLGGVILMSTMTLFAYKILKLYKNDLYTFFITIVVMIFVICVNHPETKIDHSNLPTLIALVAIYFFLKYKTVNNDFSGRTVYLILSLVIMILSIFTRLPHILFIFLPLLYFFMVRKKYSLDYSTIRKPIVYYYIPVIILSVFVVILLIYKKINLLNYIGALRINFSDFSKLFNVAVLKNDMEIRKIFYFAFLMKKYIKDFIYIIILNLIFLIGIISGNKIYNNKSINSYLERIIAVLLGVLLFVFMLLKPWMWYMAVFGFILSYFIIIKLKKINTVNEFFYLFWGLALVIISFLGSNNSIRHSVPAGAVFILIPIFALFNYNNKELLIEKYNLKFLYKFTLLFFVVLLFVGLYKKTFDNNKRDKNIYYLTSMYKSPELFGIFSSKEKVDEIDGIINAAKQNIKKDQTMLCFNSIPMLHYLLNCNYLLNDPWLIQTYRDNIDVVLQGKAEQNIFPDYIIFSKKSAREKSWPDTNIIINNENKKIYDDLQNYIKEYDFISIYETSVFILYKHKGL